MNNKAIGIIPARYASSRLPGKPLADINGKPLIRRVWEAVSGSKLLSEVIIATDDKRIMEACKEFGAKVVMTPAELPSGTDRIAAACKDNDADIIVNIQGDEPMINGDSIDNLISEFTKSDADVATMYKKIDNSDDIFDPSVVKVVFSDNKKALYFSRSPIPYIRDVDKCEWIRSNDYFKHIGIYAYRRKALIDFTELKQSQLEKMESLEQLRLLQRGYSYLCVETKDSMLGVDTPNDLEKAREYFKNLESGTDK